MASPGDTKMTGMGSSVPAPGTPIPETPAGQQTDPTQIPAVKGTENTKMTGMGLTPLPETAAAPVVESTTPLGSPPVQGTTPLDLPPAQSTTSLASLTAQSTTSKATPQIQITAPVETQPSQSTPKVESTTPKVSPPSHGGNIHHPRHPLYQPQSGDSWLNASNTGEAPPTHPRTLERPSWLDSWMAETPSRPPRNVRRGSLPVLRPSDGSPESSLHFGSSPFGPSSTSPTPPIPPFQPPNPFTSSNKTTNSSNNPFSSSNPASIASKVDTTIASVIQTHNTSVWEWEDMKAALDAIIMTVDFQGEIEMHLERLRILEREMENEMEFVRRLVGDAVRTWVPRGEEEEEL